MTNLTASNTNASSINTNVTAIAVHGGIFHADDVICVALANILCGGKVDVSRLPREYKDDYSEFLYVLDVGMKFDGDQSRFAQTSPLIRRLQLRWQAVLVPFLRVSLTVIMAN